MYPLWSFIQTLFRLIDTFHIPNVTTGRYSTISRLYTVTLNEDAHNEITMKYLLQNNGSLWFITLRSRLVNVKAILNQYYVKYKITSKTLLISSLSVCRPRVSSAYAPGQENL